MGDTLKSILFTIIILGVLFLLGFWAFTSIESGSDHVKNEKIKELTKENEDLQNEIMSLRSEISLLNSEKVLPKEDVEVQTEPVVEEKEEPKPTETVINKYQDLINSLQLLVDKKVVLDDKSEGPSVGVIQKFLNIYNNTSYKVDNDFGTKTELAVKDFQKDMGLTADGGVGSTTMKRMISWLKEQ